ncbi:MAG: CoA transferase [Halapricum sp.]
MNPSDGSPGSGDGQALDGMTVVEAGTMISLPNTGRLLADFGADVIKIEHPEYGDHSRRFGPQKEGVGVWWKRLNRNKLTVTLDLDDQQGQAVFTDLVEEADVLLENFRPNTLEDWGIGWETLSEINPGLIMLRLSGFGQTGPYAQRPGFGTLAEALSGFAAINGFPDKPPLLPPTGLGDQIAGVYGVIGVMFAVYRREVNGGSGQYIDVSLIESILDVLGPQALRYDQLGELEQRTGNRSTSSAPRNVYRTADDEWVALAASTQPLAMRVLDAVGGSELTEDPRFADNESRLEHKDALNDLIESWMADHTREEILKIFDEYDATIAAVYDTSDIMADEHYKHRNAIAEIDDDEFGRARFQNVQPTLSETPGEIEHLGPRQGEYNDAVYKGLLGYDDDRLDSLRSAGVI